MHNGGETHPLEEMFMSLLGSKCVRCGSRTRQTYQDKPTCDPCRSELELALVAARETKRHCPADGVTLTKEIAHGIVIDRCPQCRGVWLDAGELERMNSDAAFEAISAMSYALPRV